MSEEAKHTPGPWELAESDDFVGGYYNGPEDCPLKPFAIRQQDDGLVIAIAVPDCIPAVEANAQLIATAPELLAALKAILAHKRTDDRSIVFMPIEVAAARAAIAKAEPS